MKNHKLLHLCTLSPLGIASAFGAHSAEQRPNIVLIMAEDRTETKNLATKYPEKHAELFQSWNNWAKSRGVIPKIFKK